MDCHYTESFKEKIINELVSSNDPCTSIYYLPDGNVFKIITAVAGNILMFHDSNYSTDVRSEKVKTIPYYEFAGKIDKETAEFIYKTHMFYAEKFNLPLFI